MQNKFIALFFFLFLAGYTIAQTDSVDTDDDNEELTWLKGDMNEVHEYGIKLGFGFSTMLGGELDNPTPAFGLNGSGYYRYRYSEKSAIQTELGISLRGSNFANQVGEYSSIKTYNLDLPLLWVRAINNKKTSHLLLGAQYSYLLNASLFVNPKQIAESQKPKLNPNDVILIAGTQFYTGFVGFQMVAKYGLVNINNGLVSGLNPPLKNKDIHTFALEICLLF
jgi:hypothetical protein